MHLAPLICVDNVPAASAWYQRLLGCTSGHGGDEYERLNASGQLVLRLHKWEVAHQHGPLGDPGKRPYGNGMVLWFELDDFDSAVAHAKSMNVEVVIDRRLSEHGNWELWLRDLEGYLVVLTTPLPEGGQSSDA
jgi:hypothetical protein